MEIIYIYIFTFIYVFSTLGYRFLASIIISYSIFCIKNISRLNSEIKLKSNLDHNFVNFLYCWVKDQEYKIIEIDGYSLSLNKTNGAYLNIKPTCIRSISNLRVKLKNNYVFI